MEKTGQLEAGISRCDECGEIATVRVGHRALCAKHRGAAGEKAASGIDSSDRLKSFCDPDAVFSH